jgi:hypothetical protein
VQGHECRGVVFVLKGIKKTCCLLEGHIQGAPSRWYVRVYTTRRSGGVGVRRQRAGLSPAPLRVARALCLGGLFSRSVV